MGHRKNKPKAKICAIYDTETSNLKDDAGKWHAYPILFQWNDLRHVPMVSYEPETQDKISFFRHGDDLIEAVEELAEWGSLTNTLPVVCGYNLLFDLQPVLFELRRRHLMRVSAQTATNVYTLDLMNEDGKEPILRFWDTFHLEMGGLAAMGRTAGLKKLNGDWDYSLVRTPETPLTDEELGYAARDVQVIPAYLRYLLEANPWLSEDMLGVNVITKTSLVRRMAENEIGPLPCGRHGLDLRAAYMALCAENFPKTYEDYGLRKACFRGGFTFTAASNASKLMYNVASMDVTSMHHTYICGRCIPSGFRPVDPQTLQAVAEHVVATPLETVLARYWKPFFSCFHARIKFTNLRLKAGSCFERWQIALTPRGKFGKNASGYWGTDSQLTIEKVIRAQGWKDRASGARFAFSKLYEAQTAIVHVSEIELWCMAQVYDWDDMEVELGELTTRQTRPPDYVTLQSNILFERKQAMKKICATYSDGVPYEGKIAESIPQGIADAVREGTASEAFLSAYYNSTVKGAFNSVYGTMAQDEMKPDYIVDDAAEIELDKETAPNQENFSERRPKRSKVLYPYGLRIVGGSRMHMVIALMLLDQALGKRVEVCGGDTDSMKVACNFDITDEDLIEAMQPLEEACDRAIEHCMERVRKNYPDKASSLNKLGHFEVERCGSAKRYALHVELWNKARISVDTDMKCHVTMAGLSRPAGRYHIERWLEDMAVVKGWDFALLNCVGYETTVTKDISFALMRTYPYFSSKLDADITDYLGNTAHVDTYESVALYPAARRLGDLSMSANRENVFYLKYILGVDVRTDERWIDMKDGEPWLQEI